MRLVADREERLDVFLARTLPEFSRARLAELVDSGGASVEGRRRKRSFRLGPGMEIELAGLPEARLAHDLTPFAMPLDVLFEDEQLLVVNKPRGLAAHPARSLKSPSLVNALLARGQGLSAKGEAFRPGIVHRLDKETTGLMVVAKSDAAHLALARQFERKSARRVYVAVVVGEVRQERIRIEAPIGRDSKRRDRMAVTKSGKPAITHVTRLSRLDDGWLLAARLETGRTHQVRVHLAAIGHPVLGDPIYAPKELRSLPLQLHAALLEFEHPETGVPVRCFCEPPEDFLAGEKVRERDLTEICLHR